MSRESSYNAIILKKTAFNEADEIVTVLTLENGKMRFLAKSVKLSKSKLQNNLQSLFFSNLRIANSKSGQLSKIIGSETIATFRSLRENLSALRSAFSAAELNIKFLPDAEPTPATFNLFKIFLQYLDSPGLGEMEAAIGLLAFKIKFLETVGLNVRYPEQPDVNLVFENSRGGFIATRTALGLPASIDALNAFLSLKKASFKDLPKNLKNTGELKNHVDSFLEYQLERDLKAEKSLRNVV